MTETGIFDTHAHYHDRRFSSEESGVPAVDELLSSLFADNICGITGIGTDVETSLEAIALAERYPHMYAAVGMYPGSCPIPFDAGKTQELIAEFGRMLSHPKVVAIGEIGLDFHYDDVPRDIQQLWFDRQMQLAGETGMPVVIHDREAHGAVMDTLCRYPGVKGILHSFSGSAEMAEQLVKMGWYISVSGVVTFKNARRLLEAVERVPLDFLLVETDCPYLTPHPHRGKTNHSGYLPYTVSRIAEIKGVSYEEVCRATRENARRVFRIME